jgi:hypothetical protein
VVFKPNLAFNARFPSTIINSGVRFNFKIHSCIPFIEAFRILNSSISFGYRCVTANVKAVTSLNVELGVEKVDVAEVKVKILKYFTQLFEAEFVTIP